MSRNAQQKKANDISSTVPNTSDGTLGSLLETESALSLLGHVEDGLGVLVEVGDDDRAHVESD